MTKWKGNPEMERHLVPIQEIDRNPENARRHSSRDIEAIAASLTDHGQQQYLLVNNDRVLLAGEGRLLAALQLGWTHMAILFSDLEGKAEQKLYAIRDNRTTELSEWDTVALGESLQELVGVYDLGETHLWEPTELGALLGPAPDPPPGDATSTTGGPDTETAGNVGPEMTFPIPVTVEQRAVFERARDALLDRLEKEEGARPKISEGRALELMVADWLSGN